jgi:hypothetical protein
MLYACLYIAQKIEETGYTFEHFCRSLKLDPAKLNLVHNEQLLMHKLQFRLNVHTPVAAVEALFRLLDIKDV